MHWIHWNIWRKVGIISFPRNFVVWVQLVHDNLFPVGTLILQNDIHCGAPSLVQPVFTYRCMEPISCKFRDIVQWPQLIRHASKWKLLFYFNFLTKYYDLPNVGDISDAWVVLNMFCFQPRWQFATHKFK